METRFGQVSVTSSPRGVATYRIEAFHDGLHKYAELRAGDLDTLRNKMQAQALQWNTSWNKQCETEARVQRTYLAKEMRRFHLEQRKAAALDQTTDAQQLLETLRTLLTSGIEIDPSFDWNKLKITTPFPEGKPSKPELPPEPQPTPAPAGPDRSALKYQAKFSMLDRLSASRKAAKRAEASRVYDADEDAWKAICAALIAEHESEMSSHRGSGWKSCAKNMSRLSLIGRPGNSPTKRRRGNSTRALTDFASDTKRRFWTLSSNIANEFSRTPSTRAVFPVNLILI